MEAKKKPNGKGNGVPGPGRPKGVPNRVTTEFRDTVRRLLEDNSENVGRWLDMVAEGDDSKGLRPDPGKALDLMARLAEFAAPKLSRAEVSGEMNVRVNLAAELAALNAAAHK